MISIIGENKGDGYLMNIALVLSGGVGRRIISEVPKQYVTVRGNMIITYAIKALCNHEMIDAVQVVADKGWWEPVLTEISSASKLKGFSEPGENRQLSILNGLRDIKKYASDESIVLVQDAVRPFASDRLIRDTIKAVEGHDGVIPVLPLKDTVYYSEDGKTVSKRLERGKILAGQAPEAFVFGKYLAANEGLTRKEILSVSGSTEPALLAGLDIVTIPGEESNFKITTNADMDRFREIIESRHI